MRISFLRPLLPAHEFPKPRAHIGLDAAVLQPHRELAADQENEHTDIKPHHQDDDRREAAVDRGII